MGDKDVYGEQRIVRYEKETHSMALGSHTGSAEIIQFPIRFRSPATSFDPKSADKSKIVYDAAYASSWYHEAAVEDALKGPKS